MRLGFGELLVILLIVLVLFGAGRLSKVMGEFGKGMRSLREGLKGEEETKPAPKDESDTKA